MRIKSISLNRIHTKRETMIWHEVWCSETHTEKWTNFTRKQEQFEGKKAISTKFVCLFADLLFDMLALMHFLFCCSGEKASFVLFCVISAQRILGGGKNFVEMCKSTWIGVHRVKRKEERTYSICLGEFCSITIAPFPKKVAVHSKSEALCHFGKNENKRSSQGSLARHAIAFEEYGLIGMYRVMANSFSHKFRFGKFLVAFSLKPLLRNWPIKQTFFFQNFDQQFQLKDKMVSKDMVPFANSMNNSSSFQSFIPL